MPPSGMALVRTSTTRPSMERSWKVSIVTWYFAIRLATSSSTAAGLLMPALRHVAHDLLQRGSNPPELRRQHQDFAELPVPADELHFLVEHGKALAHMVERGLQQVAIILYGLRGFIEEPQRQLPADIEPPQHQRHHEARGRRPDGARQQVLGELQGVHISMRRFLRVDPAHGHVIGKRALRPFLAQIARRGGDEVLDGNPRAPWPEGRHPGSRGASSMKTLVCSLSIGSRGRRSDTVTRAKRFVARLQTTPCVRWSKCR